MLQLHNLQVSKWRQWRRKRKPSVFYYKCLYPTYSSFLVINVCNQGKNFCSPCIMYVLVVLGFVMSVQGTIQNVTERCRRITCHHVLRRWRILCIRWVSNRRRREMVHRKAGWDNQVVYGAALIKLTHHICLEQGLWMRRVEPTVSDNSLWGGGSAQGNINFCRIRTKEMLLVILLYFL